MTDVSWIRKVADEYRKDAREYESHSNLSADRIAKQWHERADLLTRAADALEREERARGAKAFPLQPATDWMTFVHADGDAETPPGAQNSILADRLRATALALEGK